MLLTNAGDLDHNFNNRPGIGDEDGDGDVTDNLLALDDAVTRDNGYDPEEPLFWEIRANADISNNAKFGRPIALVTDATTFDNPATTEEDIVVWILVSFGKNGKFEFTNLESAWGDDEVVEVKRVHLEN
jgi:hypothetical protein